ncbi:TonB-dependent receptor [Thiohalocapsa marina]|uniref:TonB-dependent receptor n=1 Tax=Thiohalocapsa marina TaxID=424902 RepID=UPI0036DD6961
MKGYRLHPLTSAVAMACAMFGIWQAAESVAMAETTPEAGVETAVEVAAGSATELTEIVVEAGHSVPFPGAGQVAGPALQSARVGTSDTARLLLQVPGISLYGAGGVSSLPAIHGLADDRVRVKVDGMDLIASCPNHMNPPLSYMDPTAVGALRVFAGIVPVSLAGDHIGGSIIAESAAPEFAGPDAGSGANYSVRGEVGGYYRSNGDAYSLNLAASAATETFRIGYTGSTASADNYTAGGDFKTSTVTGRAGHTLALDEVGSTAYETRNQSLDLAWQQANHLLQARFSYQDIPEELYPNQRMDMLGNEAKRFNLDYSGEYGWGRLQAQAYYEQVDHFMDFGADKRFWYGPDSGKMAANGMPCGPISSTCAAGMPMDTEGKTLGASLGADIDLTEAQVLRLGAEYQRYRLDDYWSPSGANMYPGTFWNIRDGERDRLALYGEWEARPTPRWLTLLGIRYERVDMDAGDVRGYDTAPTAPGNQAAEAAAFNARDRRQTDHNVNLTALARYALDETRSIELGFAHLVRSPNLYERYVWSSWPMAASMNNAVGDGNGYVGDIDLEPEQANTVSLTFDWHAPDRRWEFQATPYFTHVRDFIDAVPFDAATWKPDQFNVLQYANQEARLYGIDLAGKIPLWQGDLGRFGLQGLLSYTNGENRDTGDGLYNIMPLNATLTLTHRRGGWDNAVEVVMVDAKDDLSGVRNEIETPGYTLVHLRGSYAWPRVRLDFGVENLLDRLYDLPLGGAYLGQGRTMALNPTDGTLAWGTAVPGMGRAYYVGLNLAF